MAWTQRECNTGHTSIINRPRDFWVTWRHRKRPSCPEVKFISRRTSALNSRQENQIGSINQFWDAIFNLYWRFHTWHREDMYRFDFFRRKRKTSGTNFGSRNLSTSFLSFSWNIEYFPSMRHTKEYLMFFTSIATFNFAYFENSNLLPRDHIRDIMLSTVPQTLFMFFEWRK